MTNREMIIEVLKKHSCLNSFEIKGFIHRMFAVDITPQSISGSLRPLVAQGWASKDHSPSGKVVYWLSDLGKEKFNK